MQTPSIALNISADVGKDEMATACAEGSFATRKIHNQRAALLALLKELPAGSRIGMESTGSYHESLAELAHKLGFVVYVLNPKDTRHYAKAMGLRGKTDRVDAELIARLIAHEHAKLHPWIPPTAEQRQIERLLKRRAKVSRIRAALTQSFKGVKGFAADVNALRERLDKLLARIDAKVKTLIEASTERKQDYARLRTIGGVGAVVGSSVLNTLERVPLRVPTPLLPSPASIRVPTSPDTITAGAACPSADQANCAGCSTSPPWRQQKPKSGNPCTNTIEHEGYPPQQLWSSSHGASRVPPGRSTPTRPRSTRNASRRP